MQYGLFVIPIIGIIILIIGILRAVKPDTTTESVIARIIFAKELKRHYHGHSVQIPTPIYLYKLKYSFQGRDYVVEVKTEEFLGKHKDEIMIEINPKHPELYYTPGSKTASSVVLIFLGATVLIVSIIIAAVIMTQ